MIVIENLVRKNIRQLTPYSSARSLYTEGILMDANENPFDIFGNGLNRYPDSSNFLLRKKLVETQYLASLQVENCAVGNGSDELIDLLIRIFCEPGKDSILITSPTYGMYEVAAKINNVKVIDVPLKNNFQLDVQVILKSLNKKVKMIFLCSPNNPTGNCYSRKDIMELIQKSNCIVVIDEAYGDFMTDYDKSSSVKTEKSFAGEIKNYKNLVVMKTLSKAFAMAGVRLGYALADKTIIDFIQKVKPPYNISKLATEAVLNALDKRNLVKKHIQTILNERGKIISSLKKIKTVEKIFPTDSNFILFRVKNADGVFKKLVEKGIIIRSRTNVLRDALRVSVGTGKQNKLFIKFLKEISL